MGNASNLLTVALVSFLAVVSPGPDFLIVVKNSLTYSRKIGFLTTIGISLALLIHLSYTLIGIGMVMTEGSILYLILKYCGAGYLFYIGVKGLLSSFKKQNHLNFANSGQVATLSHAAALKQGFLTNLLNPKCALFFISFFSQFVLASTPLALKISYACINWAITLSWFFALSYLITGKFILTRIDRFRLYVDRVMGIVLIAVSLKLIF